ncbi:sugar transferase [Aeoliella mucimassa]|uniref:Putative sugar transferase EpsL n=1 Tax=Aeoliella mucimassa TaxID=2527972 RepID=A0A518AKT0_9BACT|nr:sugar transferase [Aeoliella mucimassa]QDU55343.1 putative sugar transferase EpsL [Aeoliella mucimassa]
MMKRAFDIVGALVLLAVLSPLFLLVAVWMKYESRGPVLCRERRAGRGGLPFRTFKFRVLHASSAALCGTSTPRNDPQLSASGRLMRRFRIHELPQLLNVLRGEMSLVGPGPELVDRVDSLSGSDKRLLNLRPGMTDWASLWNSDEASSLAGAPDRELAYDRFIRPRKLRLQKYYLENRSLGMDLKILTFTVLRVINRQFLPRELHNFPTFGELRAEVLCLESSAMIRKHAA